MSNVGKVAGLSEADARSTPTVSALSLLGLVKHSATWERRWFQAIAAGRTFPGEWPAVSSEDKDATFRLEDDDTVESVVADYRQQVATSNELLEELDLNQRCARSEICDEDLRWVAMHMIEETARHAGHADIIRETIDGSTGR